MNLRLVILPAKRLSDGTHKIRISMSHRGHTRYFVTRFSVPSEDNLLNGQVSGVPNASYINQQLRIRMNRIYTIFDNARDAEYYSCSQLMQYISDAEVNSGPKTVRDVVEKMMEYKKSTSSESSVAMYRLAFNTMEKFFGKDFLLPLLTADHLFRFRNWMKAQGLSDTTIAIRETKVHTLVNYALKMGYVDYKISPYSMFKDMKPAMRACAITVEELRRVRDIDLTAKEDRILAFARDLFMLSFYLCGINLADLVKVDLSGPVVSFKRQKTESRRKNAMPTEFTIQPEAREIIDRIVRKGKFFLHHERDYKSLSHILTSSLPCIAERCNINSRFIYYSARKTFAQIANELFVKDSVIEYCIGDNVSQSAKVINFYISVTRRMADQSIRRVFDAVAGNKTIEQLQAELFSNTL